MRLPSSRAMLLPRPARGLVTEKRDGRWSLGKPITPVLQLSRINDRGRANAFNAVIYLIVLDLPQISGPVSMREPGRFEGKAIWP